MSPRSPPRESGAPHRPAEIEAVLDRLGVAPSKRLGQSFLTDPFVADAEAALAAPLPGARIVEVGGGLGILTEALLRRRPASLTVIERDPRLAGFLTTTFGDAISVVLGDALTVDLPAADALAGNLPFSVGTAILERVWASEVPRFVGMLQREVVDRLVASPGSRVYGRLTVLAAYFGDHEAFQTVPASAFHPVPAVEGKVLRFARRTGPPPVPSVAALTRVLDPIFAARRKQLKNLLPRVVPSGEDPAAVASRAGWPADWPHRRPEELSPGEFFRLAEALGEGASGPRRPRRVRQA